MFAYKVYRNLQNGKISIMDKRSRLVVGHADSVKLESVSFEVSQKLRQKVLDKRQKNVHAFVVGAIVGLEGFTPYKGRRVNVSFAMASPSRSVSVSYNPYKAGAFVTKPRMIPIYKATMASVNCQGKIEAYF